MAKILRTLTSSLKRVGALVAVESSLTVAKLSLSNVGELVQNAEFHLQLNGVNERFIQDLDLIVADKLGDEQGDVQCHNDAVDPKQMAKHSLVFVI